MAKVLWGRVERFSKHFKATGQELNQSTGTQIKFSICLHWFHWAITYMSVRSGTNGRKVLIQPKIKRDFKRALRKSTK